MTLSRDLMLGMLRKGSNGNQILEILNVIVGEVQEVSTETEVQVDNTGWDIEF